MTLVNKYFSNESSVNIEKPTIDIETITKQLLSDDSKRQKTLIVPDKQATVIIGGVIDGFNSSRYFSILLLTNILGTGAVSILNKKLREELKLLYNISSHIDCNSFFGQFYFTFNVQIENIQTCLDIIKKEIQKIVSGNLDEENIEKLKRRIKSMDTFDNQSMGREADLLAMIWMNFGGTFKSREEYLNKKISVTKEELIDSAKYLLGRMNILSVSSNEERSYNF